MKNIVIIGMKNSGKSALSEKIGEHYHMNVIDTDGLLEQMHGKKTNEKLICREIAKKYGHQYFSELETEVLKSINPTNAVISTGGGVPLKEENRKILKNIGTVVFLSVNPDINYERLMKNGIPSFFKYPEDPRKSFDEIWNERKSIYKNIADYTIEVKNESTDEILKKFIALKII